MRICAITNVYNEEFNLPIWLSYYGKNLGVENCIVIDHASNDNSTNMDKLMGASHIRLPPSEFNDHKRAAMISGIANSMLSSYDAVIYTDCDEILVPDPEKYSSFADYCTKMESPVGTAVGLNLIHHLELEAPISSDRPILGQRQFAQFVSPMCKSLVIRKPVTWGGGFHSASYPPNFNGLYLFHLRWVDLGECLRRLSITRTVKFADDRAGTHHRSEYSRFISIFQELSKKNCAETFDVSPYVKEFALENSSASSGLYVTKKDIRSNELLRIPAKFFGVF